METLSTDQWLLIVAAAAIAAYLLGRATGGASPEERAEKRMRDRQEADALFNRMSPTKQQEVDAELTENKVVEAIKIIREETGASLREAKQAAEARRAAMGAAAA